MGDIIVAVGTSKHGKWTYYTVALYKVELQKNGKLVYHKYKVVDESSSKAKTTRMAEEYASQHGYPFKPHVRHGDAISNPSRLASWIPCKAIKISNGKLLIRK